MSLHYQEYGNKNASLMVFLHGGGVSSWMWEKQIQYFTHYHCLVIDLPEQGNSYSSSHFSIQHSAEFIAEIIKGVKKDKKIIAIGFSLGAQVLIELISRNPNLIDVAIINSALVKPIKYIKKLLKPMIAMSFPLMRNRAFSRWQAKKLFLDNDYFETYYQEGLKMKRDTLVRIMEENMSFQLPKDFNLSKTKILVTVGEKERSFMKQSAKMIVSVHLNAVGIILPNTGHGMSLAKPNEFNLLVENWLEKDLLPKEVKGIR